jgi:ribosomal protein S18 acetylase RimI-like enzyme
MLLVAATPAHVRAMMDWFPSRRACIEWGGPEFRFPFTEETFVADTRLSALSSWSFVNDSGESIGFGQFYRRAERCHLSRLAVAPRHRGRGYGSRLIAALAELGSARLGTEQYSLFVASGNQAAIRLYERLGFERAAYPEPELGLADCYYMSASALRL